MYSSHYALKLTFFLNVYSFLRDSTWARGRERGRQRIQSRLREVSAEPEVEPEPTNREIMTWAEIKSWMFNRLSHPAPLILFFHSPVDGNLCHFQLFCDYEHSYICLLYIRKNLFKVVVIKILSTETNSKTSFTLKWAYRHTHIYIHMLLWLKHFRK